MGEKTDLLICRHEEQQRVELMERPKEELVKIIMDQWDQLDKSQQIIMKLEIQLSASRDETKVYKRVE